MTCGKPRLRVHCALSNASPTIQCAMSSQQRDRILIVDDDPEVRSLLREQVLNAARFEVFEAKDGPDGLSQIKRAAPDLIVLDLVMPGLSGSDFLVALNAQGYAGPIIVATKRGNEAMAIDAFRLGATDYLTKPLREAEVLRAIEHGLSEVRLRRERKNLMEQLQQSNRKLEARVNELTTLSGIGKSVTTVFDLQQLFNQVLDAAIFMTEADHATLLLYDDVANRLILRTGKNLTLVMQERLGEPVNDDLATLVMTSGQPLTANGDSLRRFRVTADLLAVIYAPLMIKGKAIGVLTVGNHRKRRVFDDSLLQILEILADYAAIGIANARLFNALESRARSTERAYEELKTRDLRREKLLSSVVGLRQPLVNVHSDLKQLTNTNPGTLPKALNGHVSELERMIASLLTSVDELTR